MPLEGQNERREFFGVGSQKTYRWQQRHTHSLIGVGIGVRPPLPPNRACSSRAHGSPVGVSSSGLAHHLPGFGHREKPDSREECIGPSPVVGAIVVSSFHGSTFLPPFTRATGLPRFPRLHFPTFRLQPRRCPTDRFRHQVSVYDSFQASPSPSQRADFPTPNRVRPPADRQFASGCSPPRLTATLYLRLRGLGFPRHGLPPCCASAITGAPGAGSPAMTAVAAASTAYRGRARSHGVFRPAVRR